MTQRRPAAIAGAVFAATLFAGAAALEIKGTLAMPTASRSQPLVWQGAADRVPAQYIAIKVDAMHKDGGGLFGIGNSPSLVGALPDARIVEGTAIGGAAADALKVRVPGGELPAGLTIGSRLVLGLVDPDHVICLLVPPADLADEMLVGWAGKQRCG